MKSITILLVFSALFTLVSCGSKKGTAPITETEAETKDTKEFLTEEEADYFYNNYWVSCDDFSDNCPGFAAQMITKHDYGSEKYDISTCSGTLYQNRYLITNSHCIPDDLKYAGANCFERIRVNFPRTNSFSSDTVECSRVVQVNDLKLKQPDLAVIELTRDITRTNATINPNQLTEGSTVYAYTADPIDLKDPIAVKKLKGLIKKKTCTLSTNNLYTLSTSPDSDQGLIFGNSCNVIGGNSGSGFFNQKNELIGVVFAKFDLTKLKNIYEKAEINYSYMTYTGMIQNIGCLRSVTSDAGIACAKTPKTKSNISNYINKQLTQNGFHFTDRSNIEYILEDGFKVGLKKKDNPPHQKMQLDYLESTWAEMFLN